MDLFKPRVPVGRQHPIFKMMLLDRFKPERDVLQRWAESFIDRDGKFVQEFQISFESGLWELYLHAALKEWRLPVDMHHHAPDFVVGGTHPFGLEATIAAPPAGGRPAYGYSAEDIPDDFTQFNIEATLRVCNSFDAKVKKYRKYYSGLPHMRDRPFVMGIASFDRPLSHFAAARPIMAALYGLYFDEAATPHDAEKVVSYNVSSAPKNESLNIELGLFCDDSYSDVAAVIYSSLATWGKIRALADSPDAKTIYTTIHPAEGRLKPSIRHALKRDYVEHLMDGLFVFHNPFAKHPLPPGVFDHDRIAQMTIAPDGEVLSIAPSDFLLSRMLSSFVERDT